MSPKPPSRKAQTTPVILKRFMDGCHKATQIHKEIVEHARGYGRAVLTHSIAQSKEFRE